MAHSRGIIRSFKENEVSGLCLGFEMCWLLFHKSIGGSAPIVAVLVVDPADIAAAIVPVFGVNRPRHRAYPIYFWASLVDGRKFAVGQGFCRNLIVDARCAGAIPNRAADRR